MHYELVDTPDGFTHAAGQLAAGRGPFAVDTERASAYRYDDRAFLVQIHRRGAGTFLFQPEGLRQELTAALAPALNGEDWIVHAAPEDLPSLAELGLQPGALFDTALAGRIAGFEKPNLAAMVAEFCGVELEKGHGREDWSLPTLPTEWLDYAALDVIYLPDLAEAQAELLDELGKLDYAEQEFAHIVDTFADWTAPEKDWEGLKGVNNLPSARSRAIARAVWEQRNADALRRDVSPSHILPSKLIIAMAKEQPRSPADLAAMKGFPARRKGASQKWFRLLRSVYQSDPATWPDKPRNNEGTPGKSAWQRHHPESWDFLQTMRSAIAETAADVDLPAEVLLTPAVLRETAWALTHGSLAWDTHAVAGFLDQHGARPWQIANTADLFAANRPPDAV